MRLHRLAATAFGPFPDRVEVDFDALTTGGLFLIHGATGSGKTSLLDAVCFALYADVPGSRSKRGLRSDHAGPDGVPSVELELSAGERRLRLRRAPEFTRAKKRGSGQLRVPASVSLEELHDGTWKLVSARHDEVADVVKDALGMGLDQFAKVVMLPQGEFAAFLRSSAEERREVLERLFDISRFSDVEDWLAAERRDATAAVATTEAALGTDLARLGDVLADQLPDSAHGWADLPATALPGGLAEVEDLLQARVSTAMAAFDAAASAERSASAAHTSGAQQEARRVRALQLQARLVELEARREGHEADLARTDAAVRAGTLAGHLVALRRASADSDACHERVLSSRAAITRLGVEDWSTDGVVLLLDRVQALDRMVDDIGRFALSLEDVQARTTAALARRDDLEAELAVVAATAEAAVTDHESARVLAEGLREAGAGRDLLAAHLAQGEARVALWRQVQVDDTDLARLRTEVGQARGRAQDARQVALDLQQRRIEGMAAELAGALVDGDSCPVCGSPDHPAPARPTDAVTADEVGAAQGAATRLLGAHHDAEVALASLRASSTERLARLGAHEGGAALDEAVDAARRELDAATRAARALGQAQERLAQAAQEQQVAAGAAASLHEERARLAGVITELASEAETLDTAVRQALQDHGVRCPCADDRTRAAASRQPGPVAEDIAAMAAAHGDTAQALGRHVAAVDALDTATTRLSQVGDDLQLALLAAGFADLDDVLGSVLPSAEIARLSSGCEAYEREVAAIRTSLTDPELEGAGDGEPVDLESLAQAEHAARAGLLAAQDTQTRAAACLRGLQRLRPAIEQHCTELGPALDRHVRLKDLADTVAGLGPDNTRRMRLTSFVLAARLEKVAELANERLTVMGGGRYRLEHSDQLAARGARSGLGLRVLDQWTGLSRETSTLSGGEAFMASLALALGLADAVREEAGGFDLRTLFIDEGFGTLDDDSLEEVLTVLDALREGGRAVGVVSHVAELRTRIPSQVVVHKGATGSTVTVRTPKGVSAA